MTFLDVREPDEYEQGALPNAIHLPRGHLEFQVEGHLPDETAPVVVYCGSGVRSAFAAKTMRDLGYTDVVSMIGDFNTWKDDDRPWKTPRTLTPTRQPYRRHLLLPEVGEVGQLKLLGYRRLLLLGAGGARIRRRAVPDGGAASGPSASSTWTSSTIQPPAPDPAFNGPHR